MVQDIRAGRGFAFLDPHGDLAEDLLDYIPKRRHHEVVYFNPADLSHPVGFNLLANVHPDDRHLIADSVLSVFKHIWNLDITTAPRLLQILFYSILALLEVPGSTIVEVRRLLLDPGYRRFVLNQVSDLQTRNFWTFEFPQYGQNGFEASSSVLNKLNVLTGSPMLRNVLGQTTSTFDLDFWMDNRRILIANLSRGKLGDEGSALFGALLAINIQLASMRRVNQVEDDRTDFHLYVDEFQRFVGSTFATMLSESRKYRVTLHLANQYFGQLPDDVRASIVGNVGSLLCFQVGEFDTPLLSRMLYPTTENEIGDLSPYEIYAKISQDNRTTNAFRGTTVIPNPSFFIGKRDVVIRQSRQNYTKSRVVIERRLEQRLQRRFSNWARSEPRGKGHAHGRGR